jgi:hypothetical protein
MAKRKKAKKKAVAVKSKTFNLNKFKNDIKALKKALKKASRGKVGLVVKNAPFKHCPA